MANPNPFYCTIENNMYIHSRAWRTSFSQKMADTFFVFAGAKYADKSHAGIYDYMTLMIPYVFDLITSWCYNNVGTDPVATLYVLPVTIIYLASNALRYIAASIFTLLMTPLVGIAHGLSIINGNPLKEKVLSLPLTNQGIFKDEPLLGDYLRERRKENLDDVDVHASGTYSKLTFEFKLKGYNGCIECIEGKRDHKHVDATAVLNLEDAKDHDIFDAMLKLNVGDLTERLEKTRTQFNLFQPLNNVIADGYVPEAKKKRVYT